MQFWVAKEENKTLGIIGLSDPLPKVIPFARTSKPGEIKILYIDQNEQGKGVGKSLVTFIEDEARRQNYEELLVRSAEIYRDIAWGFYKKMGYVEVGKVVGGSDENLMKVFEKVLK